MSFLWSSLNLWVLELENEQETTSHLLMVERLQNMNLEIKLL